MHRLRSRSQAELAREPDIDLDRWSEILQRPVLTGWWGRLVWWALMAILGALAAVVALARIADTVCLIRLIR